ncbi:leucine-rich repeat and calponin homology domain-containing protein 1-like isoform X3 [Branchiostoma floridae]|uniref:Leucine-rich repeat and calponin homology domain-containing protein 1-like isoform X3 n=1 Tax=Branchiostoma floridae TaxID=7739 RepID=A0A9J7M2D0_BRAFL|nr:leucine-rich repeat and calponin homology domain-containing protein 1-like isoform X3 [Branchiostoma floridae]
MMSAGCTGYVTAEVGKMAALSHGLGGTASLSNLRSLEKSFEDAQVTGKLNLSCRKLKEYPKSAISYELSDVTCADLSKNRFQEWPLEVCDYTSLENVDLYNNNIKAVPDMAVNLQCLTWLNLSRNQLTTLPIPLCYLPLQVLVVSNNKLVSLPEDIGKLKKLMNLDVSCNEISTLPLQIGEMESLRELNIRRNHLQTLPEELCQLRITRLDISCNKVTSLPACYRHLQTLCEFILDNNPLMSPPAQVCTRGRVHILKWLCQEAHKEDRKRDVMEQILDGKPANESLNGEGSPHVRMGLPSAVSQGSVVMDSGYNTASDTSNKRWSTPESEVLEDEDKLLEQVAHRTKEQRHQRAEAYYGKKIQEERERYLAETGGLGSKLEEYRDQTLERREGSYSTAIRDFESRNLPVPNGQGEEVHTVATTTTTKTADMGLEGGDEEDEEREKEERRRAAQVVHREQEKVLRTKRAQNRRWSETATTSSGQTRERSAPLSSASFNDSYRRPRPDTNWRLSSSSFRHDRDRNSLNLDLRAEGNRWDTNGPNNDQASPMRSPYSSPGLSPGTSPHVSPAARNQDPSDEFRLRQEALAARTRHEAQLARRRYEEERQRTKQLQKDAVLNFVKDPERTPTNSYNSFTMPSLKPRSAFNLTSPKNIDDMDPNFTIRRKLDIMREEMQAVEELRRNIESRLKVSLPDNLGTALMDGVVLCHLANHVRPRSISSIHVPSPAVPKLSLAKCRRNVENFLEACRRIGVPNDMLCHDEDILAQRNLSYVGITVRALVDFLPSSSAPALDTPHWSQRLPLFPVRSSCELIGFLLFYFSFMFLFMFVYVRISYASHTTS